MSAAEPAKFWEKTKLANLVRHRNGGYYARLFIDGKEVWRSLKTKTYSIAEVRLAEKQKEHRKRKAPETLADDAGMTFRQAADRHFERLDARVNIKRRTREYWREILVSLLKSWEGLDETEVRKITENACRKWAVQYAAHAGATRYNNTVALLRHVFEIAVEGGVIYANPAAALQRRTVKPKKLELPTLEQFFRFIQEMRSANGRFSRPCADFAEGLAFTGCRVSEAARIEWADLNFSTNEVLVKGDPGERTKNGEIRVVPMNPNARPLFERMRAERPDEPDSHPVFQVRECQKAMTRAAKRVGMHRITHRDLRHFFATVCIESGVDIPTVARWLGHKDGGALAMKTYGHLQREHSQTQSQKVSFNPPTAA